MIPYAGMAHPALGLTLRDTQAVDEASEEDARFEVLALEGRVVALRQRIHEAEEEEQQQQTARPAITSQPLSAEELARRRSGPRLPPGPVRNVRSLRINSGSWSNAFNMRVSMPLVAASSFPSAQHVNVQLRR